MDIIIGAPGQDEVFLFSGASRDLIRSIAVPSIPGYQFGWSATGLGDVDGDGVGDIAVGSPSTLGSMELPLPCICDITGDPCPPECIEFPEFGRIFVFSGATGDLLYEMKFLHPFLGFSLVSPGDLNGDTIPDLIASAPSFDSTLRWGKVYAFSGEDGAIVWEASEPDQDNGLGSLGMSMARITDISGDGFDDLLVSSPFFDCDPDPENFILCGGAFVLDIRTGAILRTMENPHLADNDMFGMGLSSLDDQDGDGIGDYAVGAHGLEKVTIYSASGGTEIRELSRPVGPGGVHFGFAIAATDDKDGDTTGDLWISEFGRISLMNNKGELLLQVDDPDPASPQGYGGFGVSLSPLHDLDGDLSSDLVAGDSLETVCGMEKAGAAFLVLGVRPNDPPVADAGPDRQVAAGGDCTALVTLDGTGSADPDGDSLAYAWAGTSWTATGPTPRVTLPLGPETITLTVDDGNGGTDSDTVYILVTDASPPAIETLAGRPEVLWPPGHQMAEVRLLVVAPDNCDTSPSCSITSVGSSEPVLGTGDGDTAPDWLITGDLTLRLRSERAGKGDGRTYTVTVGCRDSAGNLAERGVTIMVPHDQGKQGRDGRIG